MNKLFVLIAVVLGWIVAIFLLTPDTTGKVEPIEVTWGKQYVSAVYVDYTPLPPVSSKPRVSSRYGVWVNNPAEGRISQWLHRNAIDIANVCGTPVYAYWGGVVTTALNSGWNGGYGKYVEINHYEGLDSLYAHLSALYVKPGEAVVQGQLIGLMGTTGKSTGCHLHFEVHGTLNPLVN